MSVEALWQGLLSLVGELEAMRRAEEPPTAIVARDLPADRQPLPAGWSRDLTERQIREVLIVESTFPPIASRPTSKGYYRVILPRFHPFANTGGWQFLHRYVAERQLGRRLAKQEHVHHKPGAPKWTRRPQDLQVLEEATHGRYHYGEWQRCGPHLEPCPCGSGCERCDNSGVLQSEGAA